MPKKPVKTKRTKKPLLSGNSSNNETESSVKKIAKANKDSIAVSKQLSKRIQSSGSSRRQTTRSSIKNNEPKVCGNGKPMPSLAELEKMFEDSDDDTSESPKKPVTTKEVLLSPKSIKNIASRIIDKISNISNPSDLIDVLPPPPIVAQKKPKKSGIPYIIGCKDRPKINRKPNTTFCKGDQYGVHLNAASSDDENNCPKKAKRCKRSKKAGISKSLFNDKSDEIAQKLKDNKDDSDGSTDSNKTVAYTYYNNTESSGRPQSFSPIPSTSRDSETILKNEQLFSESVVGDNSMDVIITEYPCETIVIDDDSSIQTENKYSYYDSVEIIEPLGAKGAIKPKLSDELCMDDSVQIIEPDKSLKPNRNNNNSPIDVDDYYSSININQCLDDSDVEELQIDKIIEKNNNLLGKFAKQSELNTITHVVPSAVTVNLENNVPTKHSNSNTIDGTTNTSTLIKEGTNSQQPINFRNESRDNPSETENSLFMIHNNPNITPNVQSQKNREKMIRSIVTSFFNNMASHKNNLNCLSNVNETVDLTNDAEIPGRQTTLRQISTDPVNDSAVSVSAKPSTHVRNIGSTTVTVLPLSQQQQRLVNNTVEGIQIKPVVEARDLLPEKRKTVKSKQTDSLSSLGEDSPKRSRCFGDCPICMDTLGNNQIMSTMCGHVFCLKCIKAAIKANGKKCPTCRKVLKGVGYHQIFL